MIYYEMSQETPYDEELKNHQIYLKELHKEEILERKSARLQQNLTRLTEKDYSKYLELNAKYREHVLANKTLTEEQLNQKDQVHKKAIFSYHTHRLARKRFLRKEKMEKETAEAKEIRLQAQRKLSKEKYAQTHPKILKAWEICNHCNKSLSTDCNCMF